MDFQPSDTQREFTAAVDRYLGDNATPERARRSIEREPAGFDRDLWQGLAEMGVMGLVIPDNFGGLGLSDLELGLVAEVAGKYLTRLPLGSTIFRSAAAILHLGSEAQKSAWLPRIAAGEVVAAFVDLTTVNFSGPALAEGRLSICLPVVADAMAADILIILAPDAAWLVETASPGVERRHLRTIDLLQPSAEVRLESVRAEPLTQGDPAEAAATVRRRAAVLAAFEQVGACQAAIDEAVDYAKERRAFGRAIGSFQAVKHLLADMYVKMELAKSNTYYAGWALAQNAPDIAAAAAAAHLSACDAYRHCAANAIQIHGGIGFTWELDCHLRYRRANHLALQSGDRRLWERELVDGRVAARAREAA